MRKLLLPLLVCLGLGAQTASAVVTVQADDNVGVSFMGDVNAANNNPGIASNPTLQTAVANGDDLLIGNRVLVGTFTLSDAQIQAHATDVGFLISNFQMYGTQADQTKVGDTYGLNGAFSHTVTTGNADTSGLVNAQIYLFVLGSTDNTSFATALSTAFQVGIFYEDKTFASNWKFPSEGGVPNDTTVDFSDLTTGGAGTTVDSHAHMVIGGFGPDVSNNTGALDFRLAAVPEPGSAALAICGGVALILRRRRR